MDWYLRRKIRKQAKIVDKLSVSPIFRNVENQLKVETEILNKLIDQLSKGEDK